MTDDQINQAIADACGICHVAKAVPMYKTQEGWVVDCPQFATCLNAMHEAEKALTKEQVREYQCHMYDMACEIQATCGIWMPYSATARYRAEAFLLTLGKWSATNKESLMVGATTEQSSAVQSRSSGGSGGASTCGGKGLGIAGGALPPETQITVNGKTFCLADIDKEMAE